MPQNIHETLLEIADDQGWNEDSQIIHLCGFLQRIVNDPEWTANGELLLRHWREYLQACADKENEENFKAMHGL